MRIRLRNEQEAKDFTDPEFDRLSREQSFHHGICLRCLDTFQHKTVQDYARWLFSLSLKPIDKNLIPSFESFETFGHSFTPEELETQLKETRSEEYFRSVMETDTILLAVKGERLAGYAQLSDVKVEVQGIEPGPNDQAINAIYILSDFQGQGIGKALMDAAFDHPRFQKADNIFIDVWDENKRAVQFYLKYGFEVVGKCDVTVDGKVVGYDLVLMRPSNHKEKE